MIYGAGAAMGFTPQQVDDMSVWKFLAAAEGFRKANDPDAGRELSPDERDALWKRVQAAS